MNLLITMLSKISLDIINSRDQIPKFKVDMPLWFVLHCFKMGLSKNQNLFTTHYIGHRCIAYTYISNSQSFDTFNTCSVQSFLLRVLWSIWWPTPTYMNERRVERNFRAIRQVFMKDWGKRGLCYGSTLETSQDLNSSLSILKTIWAY